MDVQRWRQLFVDVPDWISTVTKEEMSFTPQRSAMSWKTAALSLPALFSAVMRSASFLCSLISRSSCVQAAVRRRSGGG